MRDRGGVWIDLSDLNVDRVRRIFTHGSQSLTVSIPAGLISANRSMIGVLSLEPESIHYIAAVTAVSRSSDLEQKVQLGPAVRLPRTPLCEDVIGSMPSRLRRHVSLPGQRAITLAKKTWQALFAATLKLAGLSLTDAAPVLEAVKTRTPEYRAGLSPVIAFERDAVATALDAFGGSAARRTYISSAPAVDDAPFINQLRHERVRYIEDGAIAHDILAFPGLEALRPDIVGVFQLSTDRGVLTVLNANRARVEKTLGVDLVYYNHQFKSFVLVQYKMMVGDENPRYRPDGDKNLSSELARMRRFGWSSLATSAYPDYRLSSAPFYLKVCKPSAPGDWGGRMLPGMYFPIDLWDAFMASPQSKGPRGGRVVSFDNATRRLNNSEFTRLLQHGWIGTSAPDGQRVNELLVNQLKAGRSVVAAAHAPRQGRTEYVRDTRGRFAEETDDSAL